MPRARYAVRQSVAANVRDYLVGPNYGGFGNQIGLSEASYIPSGELVDSEIFCYQGSGAGQSRRILSHVRDVQDGRAILGVDRVWDPPVDPTSQMEVHLAQFDFTVAKINEAILQAHKAVEDIYLVEVTDETVVCQVGRNHYEIPPRFRSLHSVEQDFPADVGVPGSVYDSGALNWGSQFYDQDRGLFDDASNRMLSQGFYVTAGGQPPGYWSGGVSLYLRKIGNPVGPTGAPQQLTVYLMRDFAGKPNNYFDFNFGFATRSVADVSSTYSLVQFKWQAPVFIPTDVPLHIQLLTDATSPGGISDYVAWGEDTSTSYTRGNACHYNGTTWSVIPGSALVFAVQTSVINERFRPIPRDDPSGPCRRVVNDADNSSLLWLRDPSEGARLRLRGQAQARAPQTDTDLVYVPEAYIVPKATSLLLAMMGAGPTTDSDNRDRWALYHANQAERELPRLRTQWRPNSEPCTPRGEQ